MIIIVYLQFVTNFIWPQFYFTFYSKNWWKIIHQNNLSEQTVYLIPFSPPLLKCTIKSNYIHYLFATLSYFLGIVITYVIRKYLMLQIHVTDMIKTHCITWHPSLCIFIWKLWKSKYNTITTVTSTVPTGFFFQSNHETFLISIKSFQIPNTFKYIFNLFCSYSIQFNSIPFIFFIWLVNFTYCSEISRVVIIIKKKNKSHSITSIYPSDK